MAIDVREKLVELLYDNNGLTCNNKDCRNISGVNTGWEWRGAQE